MRLRQNKLVTRLSPIMTFLWLTLVSGLEASFLPVVEADTEFDLRHGAATEVTNTCRCRARRSGSGSGSGSSRGGGSSSSVVPASGRGGTSTSNRSTLVVKILHGSEVSLDAENGVESISSGAGLRRSSVSSVLSLFASILGGLVGLARVGQSITDELRNDANRLSGAVVERSLKRSDSVKSLAVEDFM